MKKIGFNIWDDYYDDGYAPAGKIQETEGYVECEPDLPDEFHVGVVKVVYEYLKTLDLPGVVMSPGYRLDFKHLTHALRERLIYKDLKDVKLSYQGIPISIYSDS